MSDFENLLFPHIRYIGGSKSKPDKIGYYMGGEPEESDRSLIVGKEYKLSYLWFSPNKEEYRKYVWACKSEELTEHGSKKYVNVNPKNFGTIADLRERRINQIINQ
jgi:hypothetical protein